MTDATDARSGSAGPAVDRSGAPVIDPTDNVLALVTAAVQRLDDLRAAEERYNASEVRHLADMSGIREAHARELRIIESERINAIRAVDVGAVQRAAEVAAAQADAIRNQLAVTATAAQTSLAAALDPIQKDIADLRRAQYEAQGQKINVTENRTATGAVYAAIGIASTVLLAVLALAAFVAARI